MSASTKKKLRKEQNELKLTERQQQAQAEAKKLKITTIAFVVLILAIVVAFAVTISINSIKNSGVIQKNTVAATVGDHELNSVELNYYYSDAISSAYNEWNSAYGENMSAYMALMGLDLTKPLDEQKNTMSESDMTWADYFVQAALDRAKSDLALYDAAIAAGFELSAEDLDAVESNMTTLGFYAQLNGYSNVGQYLKAMYGPGANEENYRDYCIKTATANAYYVGHNDDLTYDDAAIRDYEASRLTDYNSYDFSYYYVNHTKFLPEGTKGEDGKVTYTDEQLAMARDKAKEAAQSLTKVKTQEELDSAIAALSINKGTTAASSKSNGVLGSSISSLYSKWLTSNSRKENDVAMFAYESTSTGEDGKQTTVVNGYYVVMFRGMTTNERPVGNVRHLLVKFEGGTKDDKGNTTYSDAEKAAAKTEAEGYLNTWKSGAATEESFVELVKEHSDDTSKTTGGLFENIIPTSPYVPNFLNWSIDETRKAGDTEVIETEYGYHVMYYVAASELNYRDTMISDDIRAEDQASWYEDILEAVEAKVVNDKHLEKDRILSAG